MLPLAKHLQIIQKKPKGFTNTRYLTNRSFVKKTRSNPSFKEEPNPFETLIKSAHIPNKGKSDKPENRNETKTQPSSFSETSKLGRHSKDKLNSVPSSDKLNSAPSSEKMKSNLSEARGKSGASSHTPNPLKPYRYCDFHFETAEKPLSALKLKVITPFGVDDVGASEKVAGVVDVENLPRLNHGLDVVLKSKGLYFLRDKTKLNFSPFLERIHQPLEIDYDKLPPFMSPSKDENLKKLSQETNVKFASSTSSLTAFLSHMYYLLSSFRTPVFPGFTEGLRGPYRFNSFVTKPHSVFMRKFKNVWTLDQNSGNRTITNKILQELGKSLEKMLTLSPTEFNSKMLKVSNFNGSFEPDIFHHLILNGDLLVRSQLDCYYPERGITFDLKTRSTFSIRLDPSILRTFAYDLSLVGQLQSFERELLDMLKGVFLKYYFQMKLGKMGGIFVAYHNTQELEAFEFFSEYDMGNLVFGSHDFSNLSFVGSTKLLSSLLRYIDSRFPKKENLKVTFCSTLHREMDVFIEELKSHTDSGSVSLYTDSNNFSYNAHPVSWIKMKLEHELDGQLVHGIRTYSSGQNVTLKVTFEDSQVSHKEVLLRYNEIMHRSQLYILNTKMAHL